MSGSTSFHSVAETARISIGRKTLHTGTAGEGRNLQSNHQVHHLAVLCSSTTKLIQVNPGLIEVVGMLSDLNELTWTPKACRIVVFLGSF